MKNEWRERRTENGDGRVGVRERGRDGRPQLERAQEPLQSLLGQLHVFKLPDLTSTAATSH